jgi:hypothetical protein
MSSAPDLPGELLALAREDLASAEALDEAERVSAAPVGFHAQQAVEKADRLTTYAAAIRYGLGDPGAVAPREALDWASAAIDWADDVLYPKS